MNPEIKVLINEARSVITMIRSDLDDLANDRQPPDGTDGLSCAQSRLSDLRRALEDIDKYAKRRGISLRPHVKFPPVTASARRYPEDLF